MPEIVYLPMQADCIVRFSVGAGYQQRAKIIDMENGNIVMEASGQGDPLRLIAEKKVDGSKPKDLKIGYRLIVIIEASEDGKTWMASRTRVVPGGRTPDVFCTIASEDFASTDNDWQDGYVEVILPFAIHNSQFQGIRPGLTGSNPDGNE